MRDGEQDFGNEMFDALVANTRRASTQAPAMHAARPPQLTPQPPQCAQSPTSNPASESSQSSPHTRPFGPTLQHCSATDPSPSASSPPSVEGSRIGGICIPSRVSWVRSEGTASWMSAFA